MRDVSIETHLQGRSSNYTRKPRKKTSSSKYDLKGSRPFQKGQRRSRKERSVCLKKQHCNTQNLCRLSHTSDCAPSRLTLKPSYQTHPHNHRSSLRFTNPSDLADLTFTDMKFLSKSSGKTRDDSGLQCNPYKTDRDTEQFQRPLSGIQVQFSTLDKHFPLTEGHGSISYHSRRQNTNVSEDQHGAQASTGCSARLINSRQSNSNHASLETSVLQPIEMALSREGQLTEENALPVLSIHDPRVGELSQQTQSRPGPLTIDEKLQKQPNTLAEQVGTENFFDIITRKALIGKEPGIWRSSSHRALPDTTLTLDDLLFLAKRSEPKRDLFDTALSTSRDYREEREVAFSNSPRDSKPFTTHCDWVAGMSVDPPQSLCQHAAPHILNSSGQYHQSRPLGDGSSTVSPYTVVSDQRPHMDYNRSTASDREFSDIQTTNNSLSSGASDTSKWSSPSIQAGLHFQHGSLKNPMLAQPMEVANLTDLKKAPKMPNVPQCIPQVFRDFIPENRKRGGTSSISFVSRADVVYKRFRVERPFTTEPGLSLPPGTTATQLQESNIFSNLRTDTHRPKTEYGLLFGNGRQQQWPTTRRDIDEDVCFPRFRGFDVPYLLT